MKAMILDGPGHLQAGQAEQPVPAAGEVLVRVSHSGICGTDLEIYHGGIPVDYPRIMGHEMIGEVVEHSQGGPKVGTRAIIDPVVSCGTCYQCKAGQSNLCPAGGLIGRDRDGGFAELVSVPTGNLYPLPEEIDSSDAPVIQVLTTCVHAQSVAPVRPRETVVVIGLGVTGQLHVQLAKAAGAGLVVGITNSRWKRELSEELGADVTSEPGEQAGETLMELTGGRGADLVIETSGRLPAFAQAIELARIGGRILPFSIYTGTKVDLPFYQFYYKELQILCARAAKGRDYTSSLDLIRAGKVRLHPLISHQMPLMDLGKALDALESADTRSMKIILQH